MDIHKCDKNKMNISTRTCRQKCDRNKMDIQKQLNENREVARNKAR